MEATTLSMGGHELNGALSLVEEDVHARLAPILNELDDEVPVYVTGNGSLDVVSGYGFHRGALALGRRTPGAPKKLRLDEACVDSKCTLLAAEGVAHVDNMGSLFRNAACLEASGVLLGPGCADPLFRKTVRVSSGHVFRIPWEVAADFHATLQTLKTGQGFRIIGLELSDDSRDIEAMNAGDRTVMIVGSEGDGLSDATRTLCDELVHIPGSERTGRDSLNVAVASAIGLHELRRRTRG